MSSASAKLQWRIGIVMAERGIRTNRDLVRRLRDVGYRISEPTMSRVRRQLPAKLDTEFLSALCHALEAQPGDLLHIPTISSPEQETGVTPISPPEAAPPSSDAAPTPPRQTSPMSRAVGPKLRPRSLPTP